MASRPSDPALAVSVTYASTRRVTLPSTLLSPVHSDVEEEELLQILRRATLTTEKPRTKRKRVVEQPSEDEWIEWSQDLKRRFGDDFDCETKTPVRGCPQGMRFIPLKEEKRVTYEAPEERLIEYRKRKKRASMR